MKIKREDWIFITGQANTGKTFWISRHIETFPKESVYILDYNGNDYQGFIPTQHVWNVKTGTQQEIERFLKIVYNRGNCYTVLEEADNYLLQPTDFIRQFVNTARNRGIGAMVNAKRSMAVQPVFRTRFNYIVIFRTPIPEDIEYLEKWVGTGKGSLGFIKHLEDRQHVIADVTHNKISDIKVLSGFFGEKASAIKMPERELAKKTKGGFQIPK
jgi:hypothetical protein